MNIKKHFIINFIFTGIVCALILPQLLNCDDSFFIGSCAITIYIGIGLIVASSLLFLIISTFLLHLGKRNGWSTLKIYGGSFFVLVSLFIGWVSLQYIPSIQRTIHISLLPEPTSASTLTDVSNYKLLIDGDPQNYKKDSFAVMDLYGNIIKEIDLTELTRKKYVPITYQINPDGKSVLMYHSKTTEPDIFITDLDGNILYIVEIESACKDIRLPIEWSDDGVLIAFGCGAAGTNEAQTIHYNTYEKTFITISGGFWRWNADNSIRHSPHDPIYSPDSTLQIFEKPSDYYGYGDNFTELITIQDRNGNEIFRTERGSEYQTPQWSPDGRFVLHVNRHDGIFVYDTITQKDYRVSDKDTLSAIWYKGEI